MVPEVGKCEILPLLARLRQILQDNYVLPVEDVFSLSFRRLLKLSLPLILGGIPYVVGSVGYLYVAFTRNLWPQPLLPLIYMIQMLTAVLVLTIFIGNAKNYMIGIDRMRKYVHGAPMESRGFMRRMDILCLCAFYSAKIGTAFQAITFYLREDFCYDQEFEGNYGYICGTYVPLLYFFKMDYPIVHLIIRICMFYLSASCLPVFMILIFSPLTTSYLTLMRIRELEKLIVRFIDTSEEKPLEGEQLIFFIKYHAEIVECIRVMNNSIGYDHLPLQLFMPVIIALYTYQIVLTHDIFSLISLAFWILPYFTLCLLGERLQHESSKLSEKVYSCKWYNIEDRRETINFRMFLEALRQPVKLRLRPIAALNHLFLIKILKTAYSFLIFFVDTTMH